MEVAAPGSAFAGPRHSDSSGGAWARPTSIVTSNSAPRSFLARSISSSTPVGSAREFSEETCRRVVLRIAQLLARRLFRCSALEVAEFVEAKIFTDAARASIPATARMRRDNELPELQPAALGANAAFAKAYFSGTDAFLQRAPCLAPEVWAELDEELGKRGSDVPALAVRFVEQAKHAEPTRRTGPGVDSGASGARLGKPTLDETMAVGGAAGQLADEDDDVDMDDDGPPAASLAATSSTASASASALASVHAMQATSLRQSHLAAKGAEARRKREEMAARKRAAEARAELERRRREAARAAQEAKLQQQRLKAKSEAAAAIDLKAAASAADADEEDEEDEDGEEASASSSAAFESLGGAFGSLPSGDLGAPVPQLARARSTLSEAGAFDSAGGFGGFGAAADASEAPEPEGLGAASLSTVAEDPFKPGYQSRQGDSSSAFLDDF